MKGGPSQLRDLRERAQGSDGGLTTVLVWPRKTCVCTPLATLQTRTVRSVEPDTRTSPCRASAQTPPSWPLSSCSSAPSWIEWTMIVA